MACPGFECVLGTRALVSSHVVAWKRYARYSRPSFHGHHQLRGACGDALLVSFSFSLLIFAVQRSRFRMAAVGPNSPLHFSLGRHFVCFHLDFVLIFKRESPAVTCSLKCKWS